MPLPINPRSESHCDFDAASLASGLRAIGLPQGGVDVVVSPVMSTLLGVPGVGLASYPLVQGDINLAQLLRMLRPTLLLPLLNHEIAHEGPLTR